MIVTAAGSRRAHALLLAAVLWLGVVATALAMVARPVIPPGREADVLRLVEPHALGEDLAPGWMLHSVKIDQATISFWIAGPEGAFARVTLDHPDSGPDDARETAGFALAVAARPPGSEAAVDTVIAAIERNDDGTFWEGSPTTTDEDVDAGPRFPKPSTAWLTDGLVLFAAFVAILAGLLVRVLRTAPAWSTPCLAGIFVLGTVLRLTLPVETAMAPWPYTRVLDPAGLVYQGPALAALHPDPVFLTSVITNTVRCLGLLAPLAVYVHARYLLVDPRAALVVAGVVAVLPIHLRFCHSDVAFIPSITLSSVAFALVHAATREPRWWAVVTTQIPLPLLVGLTYVVRPLNIVYFPLLLATAFVDEGISSLKDPPPRRRIALMVVSIVVVTAVVGIPHLFSSFGRQVQEGLSPSTLVAAVQVLFSLDFNTLINPKMTPPGLTLLAIFGAVELWRRRRRRLFAFILGWLTALLVAHAYVFPSEPNMQARYHLHLVVPFVLLVACGFEGVMARANPVWRRRFVPAFAVYAAVSPAVHLRFIREAEHNDMLEWNFVHGLRDAIPEGCTIIEYEGRNAGARFGRIGAYVESRTPRNKWHVIAIEEGPEASPLSEEALDALRNPRECLYWYQGLPCWGMKPSELPIAPACAAVLGDHRAVEVAAIRFPSRPYDGNLSKGLGDLEEIELVLYRLEPGGTSNDPPNR